jgi:hypothetical protein
MKKKRRSARRRRSSTIARYTLKFGAGVIEPQESNKEIFVSSEMMARVLSGDALFENLYTGYNAEFQRNPENEYNRNIVSYVVMFPTSGSARSAPSWRSPRSLSRNLHRHRLNRCDSRSTLQVHSWRSDSRCKPGDAAALDLARSDWLGTPRPSPASKDLAKAADGADRNNVWIRLPLKSSTLMQPCDLSLFQRGGRRWSIMAITPPMLHT